MPQKKQADDKELVTALVSYVDAPHISPHNRGKRNVLISLYNDHFLWAEDGDTVGFVRVRSHENEIKELIYVPPLFVGQELASDKLNLLKYLCPASGMTVQQEIQQVVALSSHRRVKAGGFALGCLARFFVDRLINDSRNAIRNATKSGYHDLITGNIWFDAPIKRQHVNIRKVGELRRAGLVHSHLL